MLAADRIVLSQCVAAGWFPKRGDAAVRCAIGDYRSRWATYASSKSRRFMIYAERALRKNKVVEQSRVVRTNTGHWAVEALVHSDAQERGFRAFMGSILGNVNWDQLAEQVRKKPRADRRKGY